MARSLPMTERVVGGGSLRGVYGEGYQLVITAQDGDDMVIDIHGGVLHGVRYLVNEVRNIFHFPVKRGGKLAMFKKILASRISSKTFQEQMARCLWCNTT
jgi:hypothetical protein